MAQERFLSMGTIADEEANGDTEAPTVDVPLAVVPDFAGFYQANYRSVVGIVFTLTGSSTASEELAQETFVRAHRNWQQLETHPNRQAWVKRVAINLSHSSARRAMAEAKVLTRLSRERPRIEELPEPAGRLWEAVRALPRNQAIAIALRYHDDQSIEQIAEVLDCAPTTVRVHLHRGRQTLAIQLDLELEENSHEA